MARTTSSARPRRIKVGDKVIVRAGELLAHAEVIEDRGSIGKGGRRLLRIRRKGETSDVDREYEVPAEELELAD